ncbi:MAG: hypothetical protein IK063_01315, partial [Clostridia bacterium]|nr:hypothetical protein [Clostridia bacterium]
DANIGESKIEPIIKVLETATSLNDLLQKVNSYVEISDVLTSSEWSTAFQYIEWAIKVGKLYEKSRDQVILAYAQILSVQAANEYYKEMLQYIADNCSYDVVVTAAENLIRDIEESVESLIKGEILDAAGFAASRLFETAAEIALNTNAYTAVALKVYNTGTSVADKLWNTSNQFALMDELYTTFFAETAVVDWAKAVTGADKYQFAVSAVLSLRQVGAQALYDLKVAQSGGIIGTIKDQINRNVTSDIIAEGLVLGMLREVLFNADPAAYSEFKTIAIAYTPATMSVGSIAIYDNESQQFYAENGYMGVVYNGYSGGYVKAAFITTDEPLGFISNKSVTASCIVDKLVNGEVVDYSFSDVAIDEGTIVSVATTEFGAAPVYTVIVNGESTDIALNADFVYPTANEINAQTIATAVKDVAKEKTYDFIRSVFASIRSAFSAIFAKFSFLDIFKK